MRIHDKGFFVEFSVWGLITTFQQLQPRTARAQHVVSLVSHAAGPGSALDCNTGPAAAAIQ